MNNFLLTLSLHSSNHRIEYLITRKGPGKSSGVSKPKVYKPKHSFAKLISDGTGPHSVLADDDFWQCPPDNDHKSELEEPLHSLGSEDLALECPKDTEVLFKTSSSHTQYKDAIGKMARILLNNQYIATFLAEQLLNDGILEEQCVDSGRANRCIKYMTSLMEASADPKRNRAGFNLSNWISKDYVKDTFFLLIRLTLDKEILTECWIELSQTFDYLVTWLDMDRIHLIIDWIRTDEGQVISEHFHRPIQVAKLLDGSRLGQIAGKIIIDCFLWPTENSGVGEMCVGDDYEFIVTLTKLLDQNPDNVNTASINSFYSKLCLASARLHLTFFEGGYKKECDALLTSINAARSNVPASHFPIYIACRDLLSKMETFLKSYLLQGRRGIIR